MYGRSFGVGFVVLILGFYSRDVVFLMDKFLLEYTSEYLSMLLHLTTSVGTDKKRRMVFSFFSPLCAFVDVGSPLAMGSIQTKNEADVRSCHFYSKFSQ